MPNCKLYKNGVQAAINAGVYNPANLASCKIQQIKSGAKSSGLGKGGRRSTRRNRSNMKRSTRRNRH
jgi:hypothetical protein